MEKNRKKLPLILTACVLAVLLLAGGVFASGIWRYFSTGDAVSIYENGIPDDLIPDEPVTEEKLIKVGIINNPPSESGYREAQVKDFETLFTAANGYDAKVFYSIHNDEQIQAAEQFITGGVDYLLISAAAPDGWDSVLQSAKDAGIKVFLFDRMIDCDENLYEAAVLLDWYSQGEIAVAWLKAQDLPEYNIIHIQGAMGSDAQMGRTAALEAEFQAGAMKRVAQQTAVWDEALAKEIVESVIHSGEQFNVIYAENDGMAKGAVAALDEAGITHGVVGDVMIISFDCNWWALLELLAGNWNYDVQCSPFQASYIDDMIKNGVPSKNVMVEDRGFDARTITQADIDTYGLGGQLAGESSAGVLPFVEPFAEDGLTKVGIINNPPSESGYREAQVKDFDALFTATNGYDAKVFYSIFPEEQISAAEQFITGGADYLLISAAAPDGWDSVLQSAKDAGIKVLLFDRMIGCDESLYESAVLPDLNTQGKLAVNWLKEQNLPEYNVIHIQGAMGSDAQLGRTAALEAEFAAGTMKRVAQQTATWDEAVARQIVESVIASGEAFNVIYAENDGMAKGAVAALDEAGITHGVDGDVIIISFDCNKWALRELLAGNWNYDVQWSPFQASYIDDMIKKGVTSKNVMVEDKGFDARTIRQADVDTYGLGD